MCGLTGNDKELPYVYELKTRREGVMKRNLTTVILVIFTCLSVFLLFSCAKKEILTEEKAIGAPPAEVAEVEKEEGTAPAKGEQQEISTGEEGVRIERLQELEMAKKEEAEAKALQQAAALKFEAESIFFDFDKSTIRKEYRPLLEKKAAFLRDNTSIRLRIEGNCDKRGSNEYNLALGERRADSAKRFLVSLGISPNRMETVSYGEERPLALGDSEDAWAKNRRDDFVIIEK
jgi:peptidoglycan-associated lipoprotein